MAVAAVKVEWASTVVDAELFSFRPQQERTPRRVEGHPPGQKERSIPSALGSSGVLYLLERARPCARLPRERSSRRPKDQAASPFDSSGVESPHAYCES